MVINTCKYCKNEPEPGYIETPNNGPIVPCIVCNSQTKKEELSAQREREFELAVAQRSGKTVRRIFRRYK